ncbi:MAG: hypothetical protein ACRD2W_04370, partial [Acidimicrobiales bacterium]
FLPSGSGSVIVKYESGSAGESKAEGSARWLHGNWMADAVMENVPRGKRLDPSESERRGADRSLGRKPARPRHKGS